MVSRGSGGWIFWVCVFVCELKPLRSFNRFKGEIDAEQVVFSIQVVPPPPLPVLAFVRSLYSYLGVCVCVCVLLVT